MLRGLLRSGRFSPKATIAVGAMAMAVAALALGPSTSAGAQADGTWVSGVGNDVNPCSRTAPCKTFVGAISKTAAGGQINVLDPGGFGVVTIGKSITIDGGGILAHSLASGANGIIVNAGPDDVVVLRGLFINGAAPLPVNQGTNGIRFIAGKTLVVEDTIIERFGAGTGRGIDVQLGAPGELHVSNTTIRNNSGAGIFVGGNGSTTVSVNHSMIQNNNAGIEAGSNANVMVAGTTITGNTTAGLRALPVAGTAQINADHVMLAFNGTGIQSGGNARAATVRVANSTVVNNTVGLDRQNPAEILSAGNNRIFGNGTNGTFNAQIGTPPPQPVAVSCAPRPRVTVQVTPSGSGQFVATITANTNAVAGTATNSVQVLKFGAATNAVISGASIPAGSHGGIDVPVVGSLTTTSFTVQRITAGQPFTVPVTVKDGCGDWPTLVGEGTGMP